MTVERLLEKKSQQEEVDGGISQISEYLGPKESEEQLRGMYLINTRLWLNDLSKKYETTITIDNVPDEEWENMFDRYDNFWFMGIYKPSQKGQESAEKYINQYRGYLTDIDKNDVVSSPFAITEYSLSPLIAKNWEEWDKMVRKLHERGKKVFIDFVPNHTALDHPWVESHPEYYIQGDEQQFLNTNNFVKIIDSQDKVRYFAYGKDPNFSTPWVDTLQLNYGNLELQDKMREELIKLAKHADGFRCDMAMLINPETFIRNWGWCMSDDEKKNIRENQFWQKTIPEVKKKIALESNRNIEFIAEAYWEERELGENFDFIYDHNLYKKILESVYTGLVDNLKPHLDYLIKGQNQEKNHWIEYTENHDERRAAEFLGEKFSKPAAVLTAMIRDSIFMVNQGQEIGCRYRPPMQVSRYRKEETNSDMVRFYADLLSIRRSNLFQTGEIKLINSENNDQNSILFEISKTSTKTRAIVAVNMSQWTSFAQIKKDEDHLDIYNLTSGHKSDNDQVDDKNLILKLEPGEVKIACLTTTTPENSKPEDACVLAEIEIQPRVCF